MARYDCEGVRDFENIMAEILVNARAGHLPWIHVECHGSDDGLIFANGSELPWNELCDLLRPINEASGFQLFVVLSCCYGGGMVTGMDTGLGSPCVGLIGPSHEADPAELLGHFRDFYRQLFTTTDIGIAFRSWSSRSLQNGQMAVITAESWWRQLMSRYLAENATRSGVAATARRQRKIQREGGDVVEHVGALRRKYVARLPEIVERRFKTFFMFNEVPSNQARFNNALSAVRDEVRTFVKKQSSG